MLTQYDPIGNARRTSIANATKRKLPAARRSVVNANGLKSGNSLRPVNVTDNPNTSRVHTSKTNTEVEPGGYRHIPPRVISHAPSHHIKLVDSSRDTSPFPLTRAEGLSLISGQFPLTMEVASSRASDLCRHTTEEDNSQASDLYPHTTEEDNSQVNGLFLHISPVERCPASAPSRLTTVVEPCRTPSRFLLITPEVDYPAPNLSPLIWAEETSQEPPLLPRTTPTRTTDLPTMKLRGKWTI